MVGGTIEARPPAPATHPADKLPLYRRFFTISSNAIGPIAPQLAVLDPETMAIPVPVPIVANRRPAGKPENSFSKPLYKSEAKPVDTTSCAIRINSGIAVRTKFSGVHISKLLTASTPTSRPAKTTRRANPVKPREIATGTPIIKRPIKTTATIATVITIFTCSATHHIALTT
ncbi:hypothetical protein ES703_113555 [subsurface metagenome]